jgi:regulatory LuxR family protein
LQNASGRSNQEVAAELFVSTKTVEANLTRVYRKLSVRSRTELAKFLIKSDPETAPESAQWFALSRQVELRRRADEGKTGLLPPPLTHADIGI